MISELHLMNFKCFNNHRIDFAPLTLLVGGNASGKSTIIQAILLARQSIETIISRNMLERKYEFFDLRINGLYMMQLGKALNVFSSNPISDNILLRLRGISDEIVLKFNYDAKYASHLLKGSIDYISTDKFDSIPVSNELSYIHAERLGPRKSLEMCTSSSLTVGYQGEYVSFVIFQADTTRIEVNELLKIEQQSNRFSHQVQAWLNFILPHQEVGYRVIEELNAVSMEYKNNSLDTNFFPPPNTGFGISYVLPIIVEGLLLSTKNRSTMIIENPEAHLHPMSQSRIGRFLALLSQCGVQIIIETHSEHVVNGARLQMAANNVADQVKINFFSQNDQGINVKPLLVNQFGELSEWPVGFFDQEQLDSKELFLIRREKKK
ncbi:AAA family ATPase [Desulforamulus aquiferis]|uniref:DUF3696 domain-containing protein n=1 Tax=Desulforamulus aquiferis TaxID=1397668 RepID=A0AAW7ZFQ9_9FIRM|nr:DUF3696 domain-containing protein [Desulforamulus aquiferis]MDO7787866.1 DUF3696 domain-containing protein [Desulforamulus aquiferis]